MTFFRIPGVPHCELDANRPALGYSRDPASSSLA
jgi:hypothetical protein